MLPANDNFKISAIAWVSKNREQLLFRSIKSFSDAVKETKTVFSFYVSGTDLGPEEKKVNSINKKELCEKLIEKTKDKGVPPEIIEFALLGDPKLESLSVIDTGTNRNALLLTLIDKVFLTVDDDVLCKFSSTESFSDSEVIFDPNLKQRNSQFFLDEFDCEKAIDYPEKSELTEFLLAHEKLLNYKKEDSLESRVVATVSGIHGDSGVGSPRDSLLMSFDSPELYKAAIKNKLILRYVNSPTVTNRPFFMSMCACLDNRVMLPPFFPVGRNQDGIFGSATITCIPNSFIGYVPWVVRHDSIPKREYKDGEVSIWRFRISEMINLLLENFSRANILNNSLKDSERYEIVGKYLENFSKQEPDVFIESLRKLCVPRLDEYTNYLRRLIILKRDAVPQQLKDISDCIENIELTKRKDDFCIPEELLKIEDINESIKLAKSLIFKYGALLRFWPEIHYAAKDIK